MSTKRNAVLITAATVALAAGVLTAFHGHTDTAAARGALAAQPSSSTSASVLPTATPPAPATLLHPAGANLGGKYLGVALPDGAAGLPAFAQQSGTRPDLSEIFTDVGSPFPTTAAEQDQAQGATTLISWMSMHQSLAQIAAGYDDAQLRTFAAGAKAYAWPVFLDFDHEFNGNWYPWGTQAASAAQFVAAWVHVHNVLAAAGADNVVWVWSPNVVNPVPGVQLASYWPGSTYVDVVGIVGYYTGNLGENSYRNLFSRTEDVVDAFASKPFLITEAGAQQGPDKAGWVTDLLDGVRTDPRMIGLVYFDEGSAQGKREDWTLQDDPKAMAAWRSDATALSTAAAAG